MWFVLYCGCVRTSMIRRSDRPRLSASKRVLQPGSRGSAAREATSPLKQRGGSAAGDAMK